MFDNKALVCVAYEWVSAVGARFSPELSEDADTLLVCRWQDVHIGCFVCSAGYVTSPFITPHGQLSAEGRWK